MILGRQTLVELYGCDADRLRDHAALRALMLDAVREAGGTYVTDVFHQFSPHGISGVVVIAESHVTLHTWPEHGYAAADIFTCSESFAHDVFVQRLREGVRAERVDTQLVERGRMREPQ